MRIEVGSSGVSIGELKSKGLLGKVMYDIVCFDQTSCRDNDAYLELLEHTAKEIIEKVNKEEG